MAEVPQDGLRRVTAKSLFAGSPAGDLDALACVAPPDRSPAAVYLAGLAPSGRRTVQGKLDKVARWLGYPNALAAPWGDLRLQHVVAVRARLLEEGRAPKTVNGTLHALRGVARAALNLGLLPKAEYERLFEVEPARGDRPLPGRALKTREIERLLWACVKHANAKGYRDAALLALLYATGLRRAEVVALDLADFDPESGGLLVRRGKGNKQRRLWVSGGCRAVLQDWLTHRGQKPGPLFLPINKCGRIEARRMTDQAVYNILKLRATEARIEAFSPIDLRRTFATRLLESGVDALTVQKLMGHAEVTTTFAYDRREGEDQGDEAARRAVGLLDAPYRRPDEASWPSDEEEARGDRPLPLIVTPPSGTAGPLVPDSEPSTDG